MSKWQFCHTRAELFLICYLWGNHDKYFSSLGSDFFGFGCWGLILLLSKFVVNEEDAGDVAFKLGNMVYEMNAKNNKIKK